jgi:hypothetical protein
MRLTTTTGGDEVKAFVLRVPVSLREQIVSEARKNHRTISGEIRLRLERDLAREQSERGAAA